MQPPPMGSVEREDSRSAFWVRLDEDGVPDRVRVAGDWSRRVHHEDIGQAVLEAYGTAVSVRMRAWSDHLQHNGSQEPADAIGGGTEAQAAEGSGAPPSLGKIAEGAITQLQSAGDLPVPESAEHETPNASRRAVISLTGGHMASCQVDARWARRQSATSLATALNRALERARTKFRQETQDLQTAHAAQAERTQALFNDALEIVKNPQRYTDT